VGRRHPDRACVYGGGARPLRLGERLAAPVSVVQPPDDADLLELLYRYAPGEAELRKILVTNPAKLFGFEN